MKNRFHNPWIDDTPSTGFSVYPWKKFFDFTNSQKKKEKKKRSHSQTTIVAAQTRDNNSGENSQSIWKRRYSLLLCRIRSVKGVASFLPSYSRRGRAEDLAHPPFVPFSFSFFFPRTRRESFKGKNRTCLVEHIDSFQLV